MSLILSLLIGGVVGAAMGYFGKCSTGACPLTANPWRGAFVGAVLGLLFYMTSGAGTSAPESTPNVKQITETQFDTEVANSAMPVVVDFYATWCGPCKILSPRLNDAAGAFTNKLKVVKVDIDQSRHLAEQYQIEGVPTLLFFRNGQVVDHVMGLLPEGELKARLKSFANGAETPAVSSSGAKASN